MSNRKLHIVTFDNPWPPDYGGRQDVFYKIQALVKEGVEIILHYFGDESDSSDELSALVKSRYVYPKKKLRNLLFGKMPYRTAMRSDEALLDRLASDDHPVLFEGLHSAYYASSERLRHKVRMIRVHNVESDYMRALGKLARNPLVRRYFSYEATRFAYQERTIDPDVLMLALTRADVEYFSGLGYKVELIPVFHANAEVTGKTGRGDYVLIHGNMAVLENLDSVYYYVKNIHERVRLPLVIAGRNPPADLKRLSTDIPNCRLVENPDRAHMDELVGDAHVHFLYTRQATGIKLKLINSLYQGRFCVTNGTMVNGTGLESACEVFDDADQAVQLISDLSDREFDSECMTLRRLVLGEGFSNQANARRIKNLV